MFRKLLDEGRAGDNVGLLVRGLKKDDIERGQVIAKPWFITSSHKFTAEVYVLSRTKVVATLRFFKQLSSAVLLPHHGCDRFR